MRVLHLGSWILGQVLRRLSADWQKKYGHPITLVETFVEGARFRGTVYRAANWQHVGQTAGRTRQDRYNCLQVPVKDIYVYPVEARKLYRIEVQVRLLAPENRYQIRREQAPSIWEALHKRRRSQNPSCYPKVRWARPSNTFSMRTRRCWDIWRTDASRSITISSRMPFDPPRLDVSAGCSSAIPKPDGAVPSSTRC